VGLSECHVERALMYQKERDWRRAAKELRQAVELDDQSVQVRARRPGKARPGRARQGKAAADLAPGDGGALHLAVCRPVARRRSWRVQPGAGSSQGIYSSDT
jgi:hypothetical protein